MALSSTPHIPGDPQPAPSVGKAKPWRELSTSQYLKADLKSYQIREVELAPGKPAACITIDWIDRSYLVTDGLEGPANIELPVGFDIQRLDEYLGSPDRMPFPVSRADLSLPPSGTWLREYLDLAARYQRSLEGVEKLTGELIDRMKDPAKDPFGYAKAVHMQELAAETSHDTNAAGQSLGQALQILYIRRTHDTGRIRQRLMEEGPGGKPTPKEESHKHAQMSIDVLTESGLIQMLPDQHQDVICRSILGHVAKNKDELRNRYGIQSGTTEDVAVSDLMEVDRGDLVRRFDSLDPEWVFSQRKWYIGRSDGAGQEHFPADLVTRLNQEESGLVGQAREALQRVFNEIPNDRSDSDLSRLQTGFEKIYHAPPTPALIARFSQGTLISYQEEVATLQYSVADYGLIIAAMLFGLEKRASILGAVSSRAFRNTQQHIRERCDQAQYQTIFDTIARHVEKFGITREQLHHHLGTTP